MSATISSINYCPVKSVSFQTIETCEIKKDIGIVNDRIFAFTKDLDQEQANLFEKSPDDRKGKWNKILENFITTLTKMQKILKLIFLKA